MLTKLIKKLKSRSLLSIIYERFYIYNFNLFKGFLSKKIFKLIFNNNFSIGKNLHCWGFISIRIHENAKIIIGDDCKIVSNAHRAGITIFSKFKATALFNSRIVIGNNVSFNGTAISCRTTEIIISDGTIIAPNVIIVDSDFHSTSASKNRENNHDYLSDSPVFIGSNVWIGMNSIILKGVTIGKNTIVAAGSVVTKDLESNIIAAGNPARKVRDL
tara:strand:+ start:303 stop:950 length:648 start_codon:yes stop_codon:yes gene_type:complete